MNDNNAVTINGLTKVYSGMIRSKSVRALDEVSLSIQQGSIFGLLGPNGAGKTTMIKILLGITSPTGGSAALLGEDIKNYKVKERVGYLPENHRYPNFLNGGDVLKFFGELSGRDSKFLAKRIPELLELVRMSKWRKTKIKNYSKGMMQRLGLAQALINDPDLVFLDEPTDGVDPIGRKEIREILKDLKNAGKTVFVNSHLLSEVELVSDRVAILNEGKLVREGTVEELTSKKDEYRITVEDELPENFFETNREKFNPVKESENKYLVHVENTSVLNELIDLLRKDNIRITTVQPEKTTLEDMFISLIKEGGDKK